MSHLLKIDIQSFWHPGTGRGHGSALDATTHRDWRGLPSLPGRTIKGLLRDAVHRWEQFGGYGDSPSDSFPIADVLFGPLGVGGMTTRPGLLRCSDATLPQAEAAYLEEHPELIEGLYRDQFATAIEHDTGTAVQKSLRGIELVIPLTLWAAVDAVPGARHANPRDRWPGLLTAALPLIRAVGAHRSRGLGRAALTLQQSS